MYVDHGTFIRRADGACIPIDPENADYAVYLEWVAEGNSPQSLPQPDLSERIAALLAAVDAHLQDAAKARRYDSIVTASLRAGYPGPFHDEGVAFATWMDATYEACYRLLARFNAGEIAEPTPTELIALLPALELPS